jgi:ubiquinone/menaquinone biosynthesis C-methylase UbiE
VIDGDMQRYYEQGRERERLTRGGGTLELVRTQELLQRYLPPPPADVLDVGGGPGVYAAWLAKQGYRVHLIDPLLLHIEQATDAAAAQPDHPFTAAVGDARRLAEPDASCDAALLFGPLYHLTERAERLAALAEARRVLRPGGIALVMAISRFASLLDGVRQGYLGDLEAAQVIEETLRSGQNWNPGLEHFPNWFTTAYFHQPAELAAEVTECGFTLEAIIGIEGPGGFVGNGWDDPQQRPHILGAARLVEQEASLLGLSPHLLAVARTSL